MGKQNEGTLIRVLFRGANLYHALLNTFSFILKFFVNFFTSIAFIFHPPFHFARIARGHNLAIMAKTKSPCKEIPLRLLHKDYISRFCVCIPLCIYTARCYSRYTPKYKFILTYFSIIVNQFK